MNDTRTPATNNYLKYAIMDALRHPEIQALFLTFAIAQTPAASEVTPEGLVTFYNETADRLLATQNSERRRG